MKTIKVILIILTMGLLGINPLFSDGQPPAQMGDVVFNATQIPHVLALYKEIAQVELIIDSRSTYVMKTITLRTPPTLRKETLRLIEKALLEQAGIVVTHLDEKRVSITYNDQLPIIPVEKEATH